MERYAVVGNPIAHSKSPQIHNLFAAQLDQNMGYETLLAPLDEFADTVRQFFAGGGRGLNVTVPFKEQAWRLVEHRAERAELAGAVNTILLDADGGLRGDNTDGVGLTRDLKQNLGLTLKNKHILIIGAGGAVRGVLEPLLAEQPAQIEIINRTPEKALMLAQHFTGLGQVRGGGLKDAHADYDLVINGTAASLGGEVPEINPRCVEGAFCYDMMYANTATPFMAWAQQEGAAGSADGLGMLVEQAAESFFLWRGLRPHTEEVIASLRQEV